MGADLGEQERVPSASPARTATGLVHVAVPSLILRLTWRPLAWAGLVVAAISLLSTFTLIAPALDATLPVGRFGSLIWLLIVSVTLPHSRHEVPRPNGQDAQRVAA